MTEQPFAENDATFIGSSALLTTLYDTYIEHIGIAEPDGPDGPYIWCACGWRSDDLGPNDSPGESYAVHLINAQHAAAVKALQPIVTRVTPPDGGAETYGGTAETCGVLHSHIIPCEVAHPIPPERTNDE